MPDSLRPVTVQYRKYPDRRHWRHDMWRLGEDEHGIWLGAPAGSTVQRSTEPPVAWPTPFVQLIPRGEWFTVLGNPPESPHSIYVDVTTEPVWVTKDRVEMIDLDLDIVRGWDGKVTLLDQDEFLRHQDSLGYPPPMIDRAMLTTDRIMKEARDFVEPFGSLPQHWLGVLATAFP